jgi:hypothetical protein
VDVIKEFNDSGEQIMGMFDDIRVEEGIKVGKELIYEFQTKDLVNCLIRYKIENNKLYQEVVKSRKPKKSEQTAIKGVNGKEVRLPLVILEHEGWITTNYTCGLNIYASYGKNGWIDVCYLIDNGVIIKQKINIRKMK